MWLRYFGYHYDCIAIYVYDLIIDSKDTQKIVDTLMKKHNFKLRGTVPISYNLRCDFGRDKDGTLHFAPRKYIEKME